MTVLKLKSFKKTHFIAGVLGLSLVGYGAFTAISNFWEGKVASQKLKTEASIKQSFNRELFQNDFWPASVNVKDDEYRVDYTFNAKLTSYVKKLLKRHRSDYSAIVVIDNDTSEILTAVGYEKEKNDFNRSLIFSSTHPAASLFKVVTSADLLENNKTGLKNKFDYRGRGTTLYRYQLKNKKTRWSRSMTFEQAFAKSNNVIFGKAAIQKTTSQDIFKMASLFGFNKELMPIVSSVRSQIELPADDYNLAELASGFNKETLISPIHGALISTIVANGGVYRQPTIVKEFVRSSDGKSFWDDPNYGEAVINKSTSDDLKVLMKATVTSGTARRHFRRISRKLRGKLEIGGKTGSITGGLPYGKRDWFTSYAIPKEGSDKGISICVMNINVKKWYVKSTFLAKNIIEYYYKEVEPLDKPIVTADYVRE